MKRLAVAALVVLASGCPDKGAKERATSPCGAGVPEVATLRDGDGALVRTLRGRDRLAVCTPTATVTAFVVNREITTPSGATRATLAREGASDVTITGTPSLRLHDEAGELRVLRPDGVPLGAITTGSEGAPLATIVDAGGRPIATIEAHNDGLAIRGSDGATRTLISPRPPVGDARLAGLVAVPGISPDDALAIAWAFPRPEGRAR